MDYKDVTIGQFQRLQSAVKIHEDNVYEVGMNILNIFEGLPIEDVRKWSVDKFDSRLEKYSFLNTLPSDNWIKEFTFKGKVYKVAQTPDKWNVGQYVSMSNLTKDSEKIIDNTHIIVAVMVGKDLTLDGIMELSEQFQNELSIEIAYPLAVFFCAVMLMLPQDIIHYLRERELSIGLVSNGVGMTP